MRPFGKRIRSPVRRNNGFDISVEPPSVQQVAARTLFNYISGFANTLDRTVFSSSSGLTLSVDSGCSAALRLLREVAKHDSSVFLIGNGGSSAVASHIANDLCNTSRLRAITLNDHAILTCFSNDYGYADAYAMHIARIARSGDLLIAISSSGGSQNILKAISQMHRLGGRVMTLTGFRNDNPVRGLGDLNVWLDSTEYGMVETGHLLVMHYLADRLSSEGLIHNGE